MSRYHGCMTHDFTMVPFSITTSKHSSSNGSCNISASRTFISDTNTNRKGIMRRATTSSVLYCKHQMILRKQLAHLKLGLSLTNLVNERKRTIKKYILTQTDANRERIEIDKVTLVIQSWTLLLMVPILLLSCDTDYRIHTPDDPEVQKVGSQGKGGIKKLRLLKPRDHTKGSNRFQNEPYYIKHISRNTSHATD